MAHTNRTQFASLPLFTSKDKPSWLGDFNDAMEKADAKMNEMQRQINSLSADIVKLQNGGK